MRYVTTIKYETSLPFTAQLTFIIWQLLMTADRLTDLHVSFDKNHSFFTIEYVHVAPALPRIIVITPVNDFSLIL